MKFVDARALEATEGMQGEHQFEHRHVDVESVQAARRHLESGKSAVLYGSAGSGLSYAARSAVNGAVRLTLPSGPLQAADVLVQAAGQVYDGQAILTPFSRGRTDEALDQLERQLGRRWLLVDNAEQLEGRARSLADQAPEEAVQNEWRATFKKWLCQLGEKHPILVVTSGSREPWQAFQGVGHSFPAREWPRKLRYAPDGWKDWKALAERLSGRPRGFALAQALVPLLPDDVYRDQLLREVSELGPQQVEVHLRRMLREVAPSPWRKLLAAVRVAEGVPVDILKACLLSEEELPAWQTLSEAGLILTDKGRVGLLGGLGDLAGEILPRALLQRVVRSLLAGVNRFDALDAESAESIFRAHVIYLALGEFDEAARLAHLHVGGLVDLARRVSLEEQYRPAWQYYTRIEGLLRPPDDHPKHLRSYVRHYATWNGLNAEALTEGDALRGFDEARDLWPDNALWQSRYVASLARLGREDEARAALTAAYAVVPPHPRRTATLLPEPAWAALRAGLGRLGLEWMGQLEDELTDTVDADGRNRLDSLKRRWESGVELSTVPLPQVGERLVLLRPVEARVAEIGRGWLATADRVWHGRGATALEALVAVGQRLYERARYLFGAPYGRLSEADLREKQQLIALVDPVNSDLGYPHRGHRWFIGRIEGGRFRRVDGPEEPIELGPGVVADDDPLGLWFGRVPVYRDGHPSGKVERLAVAGMGHSIWELLDHLRQLPTEPSVVGD